VIDASVQLIVKKWLGRKGRRIVTNRGIKNLHSPESRRAQREHKNALPADAQGMDAGARNSDSESEDFITWDRYSQLELES